MMTSSGNTARLISYKLPSAKQQALSKLQQVRKMYNHRSDAAFAAHPTQLPILLKLVSSAGGVGNTSSSAAVLVKGAGSIFANGFEAL